MKGNTIVLTPAQLDSFAAAFTVLGNLHLAPADARTMEQVISLIDAWPLATGDAAGTTEGIALLKESGRAGESAQSVARDQDLLYGITATAKVPPYESVHRSREGLVFERETLDVRARYRELGLQAPHLNREPDDHIGLELNFLAHCCLEALSAWDAGEEEDANRILTLADRFTRDHLATWAPEMLRAASSQAETLWLRGLEQLTLGALTEWAAAWDAGE